jgi:hypothetical protein
MEAELLKTMNEPSERSLFSRNSREQHDSMQQEKTIPATSQNTMLIGPFSAEETKHLRRVQSRFNGDPDNYDRVFNEKRLRFIRYLIEIGMLTDDTEVA